MLTLERKDGEAIIIQHKGEELRIKFRHARGDKVKLDFDGPTEFVILREELN
jgi:carbon storage regulator CsrA